MSGPVPLIRRFTPISRHYQEHDFSLEQAWPVLDRGERRDWGLLREDYRAVILADAGAGKTFELKAEAARLDARGLAAFFIRIEDIDKAFGSAFEVGSAGGFESWLCGAEEAWFFLDAVDEARLEAPRAFDAALRAFATRIHDARHRGHVYVSSRPYAWRRQIAQNAGHDGAVVVGNLLREADQTMGFNAQTDKYENLIQSGVIDPTMVVRSALQDAASVAGLLITTEAAITDVVDDKPAMSGMPGGGGMGGMGGMDF